MTSAWHHFWTELESPKRDPNWVVVFLDMLLLDSWIGIAGIGFLGLDSLVWIPGSDHNEQKEPQSATHETEKPRK